MSKPTTLTVEAMAERKRKRELEVAAKASAAKARGGLRASVVDDEGLDDDGSLDLGWIASKRATVRQRTDVEAVVRNQRLAEMFPGVAQLVASKEGQRMLEQGSSNIHLAKEVGRGDDRVFAIPIGVFQSFTHTNHPPRSSVHVLLRLRSAS